MSNRLTYLLQQAKELLLKEEWDSLISVSTEIIQLTSDSGIKSNAYACRGLAHYHKENYNKVVENCSKVMELKPDDFASYRLRGMAFYFQRNPTDAFKDFVKCGECNKTQKSIDPYVYIASRIDGFNLSDTEKTTLFDP